MACTISVKSLTNGCLITIACFCVPGTQHLQLGENHWALTKMNSKETTFGMYICMGGDMFSCSLFFKLLHVEHEGFFSRKALLKQWCFMFMTTLIQLNWIIFSMLNGLFAFGFFF